MPLVSPGEALPKVLGESQVSVRHAQEMSDEGDALCSEHPQVQVVPAAMAGGDGVRGQLRRRRRQGLHRLGQKAGVDQPVEDVLPPNPARDPGCPAAGENDLSAGLVELLGDLAA
jgi:hypothetical protein